MFILSLFTMKSFRYILEIPNFSSYLLWVCYSKASVVGCVIALSHDSFASVYNVERLALYQPDWVSVDSLIATVISYAALTDWLLIKRILQKVFISKNSLKVVDYLITIVLIQFRIRSFNYYQLSLFRLVTGFWATLFIKILSSLL